MIWTDELAEAVKKLWQQGHSGTEIGRIYGLARNQVLGKLSRMGLLGFRKPRTRSDQLQHRLNTRKRKRSDGLPLAKPKQLPPSPEDAQRSFNWGYGPIYDITQLKLHHCRWPLGDPAQEGFAYCAAPTEKGPYCPSHSQIAYVEPFYRRR